MFSQIYTFLWEKKTRNNMLFLPFIIASLCKLRVDLLKLNPKYYSSKPRIKYT